MQEIYKKQVCYSKIHAKIFEIILIIGFLFSIILLIINLVISLWCFKHSYPLFIIEIGLLSLNGLSFILSIILRVWRSDGSVFNKNFSSSNKIAVFNLILVIINLLASITEEVLFSLVISYLSIWIDEESIEIIQMYELYEEYGERFFLFFYDDISISIEEMIKKAEKIKKKKNIFDKIMKKNSMKKLFEIDDDKNFEENYLENKIKILKILPWIFISFNIFIQFLMFIFIIIILKRISSKSDFGFPQIDNNQSAQKNIMGNLNSGVLSIDNNNYYNGYKIRKKNLTKFKEDNANILDSELLKIANKRNEKRNSKSKKH